MRYQPDRFRGLAVLALLLVCAPARAEVSAEVDAFGNYVRTVVVTSGSARRTKIWSPFRSRTTRLMLNSTGDSVGDGWPAILENPLDHKPWVVWSHFDGTTFDLAWSRFDGRAWQTIAPLLPLDSTDADLDPVLAFDDAGRPYVAWWRNRSGRGQVYVSLFLTTRWMIPLPVSDPGENARAPVLTLLPDRRIQVTYTTSAGTVTKLVTPNAGATITDDINPFGSFSVTTVNRH
jgi:hypothetical protein